MNKFQIFNLNIKNIFYISIFIPFIFGCEDDPTKLGIGVLPDGDRLDINYIDTMTVKAMTSGPDSIISSHYGSFPYGTYNDAIFGNITANFITNVISNSSYSEYVLSNSYMIDSVVLVLLYQRYTGDTAYLPNFEIYSMEENLSMDSTYYNNFDPTGMYNSEDILLSHERIDTLENYPYFKIFLKNSYGEKLFQNLLSSIDSVYRDADSAYIKSPNDSIFKEKNKGLFLKTQPESSRVGCIFYINPDFNIANAEDNKYEIISEITVFYRNDFDSTRTRAFSFVFDAPSINMSLFNYSSSLLDEINNSTSNNVYLQTFGGTSINLELPYLETLKDQLENVVINKAEIELKVTFSDPLTNFSPYNPSQLYIRTKGDSILANDVVHRDSKNPKILESYALGKFNASENKYLINIDKFVQDYFNGDTDIMGFKITGGRLFNSSLFTETNPIAYERSIIKKENIKFRIIYTKL